MRKDLTLPALALAGGGAGFLLRRTELSTALDPATQLFTPWAPVSLALIALMAVLAVIFLLLCRGGRAPQDYPAAFRCPSTLYTTLSTASAFLFFAAAGLGILEVMDAFALWRADPRSHPVPLALGLCAAFCAAAGVAALVLGKHNYRGQASHSTSALSTVPAYAALPWLIGVYQIHSRDPILLRIAYQLLCVVFLLLALYHMAAFAYGRPRPSRCIFCGCMGLALGLTVLADGQSRFYTLACIAFMVYTLANLYALLRNTFGPPWPKRLSAEERMPPAGQQPDRTGQQTD